MSLQSQVTSSSPDCLQPPGESVSELLHQLHNAATAQSPGLSEISVLIINIDANIVKTIAACTPENSELDPPEASAAPTSNSYTLVREITDMFIASAFFQDIQVLLAPQTPLQSTGTLSFDALFSIIRLYGLVCPSARFSCAYLMPFSLAPRQFTSRTYVTWMMLYFTFPKVCCLPGCAIYFLR
jgi:hypothetical protein